MYTVRRSIVGFLFVGILGTGLHFVFDWTGGNMVAALFSAVNESIWEHIKLLFWPMALLALIQHSLWGKEHPGFWCAKLVGMLVGMVTIPVLYYTYTGALGVWVDWFNIAIFFVADGLAIWAERSLLQQGCCWLDTKEAWTAVCVLAAVVIVLTFEPPHIPLFRDPITGTYGFQ